MASILRLLIGTFAGLSLDLLPLEFLFLRLLDKVRASLELCLALGIFLELVKNVVLPELMPV